MKSTTVAVPAQSRIILIDTEYDARYTDRGVGRLACMSYSLHPGHAALVGRADAVKLWSKWVADPTVMLLGHAVCNEVAVLADESHYTATGEFGVPGFGPHWEAAHALYEANRVLDIETDQRLTHVRFGPHHASVGLGDLAKQLFGEDHSESKKISPEVRALLNSAIPYSEWPPDVLERAPWRIKFGYLQEQYGDNVDAWPQAARDYALDDVRLPWRLREWQQMIWQQDLPDAKGIPDSQAQVQFSWMLHVLAIPGWCADRERAQGIREHYRKVITHVDRALIDCGILDAPGVKLTAKRTQLQHAISDAFAGEPPLPKALAKNPPTTALTLAERREVCATDVKTVLAALKHAGVVKPKLVDALALGPEQLLAAINATAQPVLLAHLLRGEALAAANKLSKGGIDHALDDQQRLLDLAAALLPTLVNAGLIEVSEPRTIKKTRLADYIFRILGTDAPLTKTAAETIYDPTPAQRREFCSTASKTVRQAILVGGGTPLNVTDAVAKAIDAMDFDTWLVRSKQPELNAYALRSKADKTITNFLDKLDTHHRIRTSYQTLVDTGRTSSRGGGEPGKLNIQQLPRDYDKPAHLHVRGCITPDPGWAFIVADYSQLELCSLAHVLTKLVRYYAMDPKRKAFAERMLGCSISDKYESTLSRAINSDQDCHVLMASVLRSRGETYEECYALYKRADEKKSAKQLLDVEETKIIDDRQLCKALNFGLPGGLGELKFIDYAAGYGVSIDMATARHAKAAYLVTWIEMKLYFYHCGMLCKNGDAVIEQFYSKRLRGDCTFTQISNGFFQALAADGAKYAGLVLVKHAYRIPESPMYGTRPSGFVHDEYLVSSLIEQAPRALPEVERLMVQSMSLWIPDVKIKAPGKILKERWGK
jgi:hypothetical protein